MPRCPLHFKAVLGKSVVGSSASQAPCQTSLTSQAPCQTSQATRPLLATFFGDHLGVYVHLEVIRVEARRVDVQHCGCEQRRLVTDDRASSLHLLVGEKLHLQRACRLNLSVTKDADCTSSVANSWRISQIDVSLAQGGVGQDRSRNTAALAAFRITLMGKVHECMAAMA